MNKICMLALANIRKSKGYTASMLVMFIIAALLLNAGLLVSLNFNSFFDTKVEELNTSDIYYIISENEYNDTIDDYINNHSNVTEMQKEDCLYMSAEIPYKSDIKDFPFLIKDMENIRELSKWELVGEHLPLDANSVYVPYNFKVTGAFELNDEIELTIDNKTITFTIKGFFEDIYFTSIDLGVLSLYLPHDVYENIYEDLEAENNNSYKATLVYANLVEVNNEVETGISNLINPDAVATSISSLNPLSFDLSLIKLGRTSMASIVAAVMVAFAAIIVIVSLIVVRFRIGNSIEEDMTKIGSLKAIGYTSRQIIASIILQFTLSATVGSAVGIGLSYLVNPLISDVFAQQSALKWVQGFDPVISGSALLLILIIVILVSFVTARRIHRLPPIVALRGGIVTHSFRKNHIPLDKWGGRLPVVLGLKSIFQNIKQSVMMIIIMIAVSFSAAFAVVMFYNTTIDTTMFAEVPGTELSNVLAMIEPDVDYVEFSENIGKMRSVRKTAYLDMTKLEINDTDVYTFVMEDFSLKETNTIYEGRYPKHSNEVAIAGILAEAADMEIGDTITVTKGDINAEYIISGLTQGGTMGGMCASLTYEGIQRIKSNYKLQQLQIYLDEGIDAEEFIIEMNQLYGDQIVYTMNGDKAQEVGMASYIDIVSTMGIAILVATILIVILVLYFVISSSIIRKKHELGIQKAVGYTTWQLMNQISLGLLPVIIIGVIIGSILGIMETNAIMSVALRGMGVMRAEFIITPVWICLFSVGICIISYLTSMLITYRIRKISAYTLVSE